MFRSAIPEYASQAFRDWWEASPMSVRVVTKSWLKDRPEAIRRLFFTYPPGTCISLDGRPAYLTSYQEVEGQPDRPGFHFSFLDPSDDYDKSFQARFFVCRDHLP